MFWAKSHAESEPRRLSGSLANQSLFPFLPLGTFVPRRTRQVGRKATMTVGSRDRTTGHTAAQKQKHRPSVCPSVSQSAHLCPRPPCPPRPRSQHKAKPQTSRKGKPQEISRTVRCTCTFAGANPRDRVSNPHATPASRNTPRHRHARVSRKPYFPREAGPGQPRAQRLLLCPRERQRLTLAPPRFPPLICCRTSLNVSRRRREAVGMDGLEAGVVCVCVFPDLSLATARDLCATSVLSCCVGPLHA